MAVDRFPAEELGFAGGDGFTGQEIEWKEREHGVDETVASPRSGVLAARFLDTFVDLDGVNVGVHETGVRVAVLPERVAAVSNSGLIATIGLNGCDAILEAGDETSGCESR